MPFIRTAPHGENTQEKGKENGVLWSDIQQQSRRGPVQPWKPVPGTLAACPSSTPSLCLFHREIPVPSSTSSRRPLFSSHLFTSLSFSPLLPPFQTWNLSHLLIRSTSLVLSSKSNHSKPVSIHPHLSTEHQQKHVRRAERSSWMT